MHVMNTIVMTIVMTIVFITDMVKILSKDIHNISIM